MKEIPILFNTDMVRAILAGRKTQTRRVIKNAFNFDGIKPCALQSIKKPCATGNLLYIRETWADITADLGVKNKTFVYKASYPEEPKPGKWLLLPKWRPSIHMPKEAARIWLDVKRVQIERLQEITDEDARKEGAENREDFRKIWEACYGSESWNSNPWVWVIEFERVAK